MWRHLSVVFLATFSAVAFPGVAFGQDCAGTTEFIRVATAATNPDDSRRQLERALTECPNSSTAAYSLALLERDRSPRRAVELLEKVLRTTEDAHFHSALGQLLVVQGDAERGALHLRRAVEMNPHDATSLGMLGVLGRRSGNLGDRTELLENSLKELDSNPIVHLNLGLAAGQQGKLFAAAAIVAGGLVSIDHAVADQTEEQIVQQFRDDIAERAAAVPYEDPAFSITGDIGGGGTGFTVAGEASNSTKRLPSRGHCEPAPMRKYAAKFAAEKKSLLR